MLETFAEYVDTLGEYNSRAAGDAVAGTMCAIFRAVGDDFAVSLLANSEHSMERWVKRGTDEFSCYKWRITVPPSLYAQYKNYEAECREADVPTFASDVWRLGRELLIGVDDIIVAPRVETDPTWRLGAQAFLAGHGTNNQGNVYRTNRPRLVHDELFFRTVEEQYLYDALVARRLPVMALPVILRTDGSKRPDGSNCRIEPDFCFVYRGRLVVVELDGGSHVESPADAEKRLLYLREAGAIIRRISSATCADAGKAKFAAAELMKTIDKEIDAHRG